MEEEEAHAVYTKISGWKKEEEGLRGAGLMRSRPDAARRSLCKAFTEPRVPGLVALCLTDGVPTAPCQEGCSGSFPLLDGEKPQ